MTHCTRERGAFGSLRDRALPTILAAALTLAAPGTAPAAPQVVVTIKPLHSLIAGVMAGIGEPDLIIRGAGSPHTYSLKPSEARLLADAQIVFWVGGSLETFMEKALRVVGSKARIVEVLRLPGIVSLAARAGGPWEVPADHDDSGPEVDGDARRGRFAEHDAATLDGHLWLDPANARVIARAAADVLGEEDPSNRARYAQSADDLVRRIDALDAEIRDRLAPARDVPFVVFHDAYQYFERRYGLRAVGSVVVSPERLPGAKRVAEMRARVRSSGARCVFGEPQFSLGLLGTVTEGTGARLGTMDSLGADLAVGPEAYFTLLRNMAASLRSCLEP